MAIRRPKPIDVPDIPARGAAPVARHFDLRADRADLRRSTERARGRRPLRSRRLKDRAHSVTAGNTVVFDRSCFTRAPTSGQRGPVRALERWLAQIGNELRVYTICNPWDRIRTSITETVTVCNSSGGRGRTWRGRACTTLPASTGAPKKSRSGPARPGRSDSIGDIERREYAQRFDPRNQFISTGVDLVELVAAVQPVLLVDEHLTPIFDEHIS